MQEPKNTPRLKMGVREGARTLAKENNFFNNSNASINKVKEW